MGRVPRTRVSLQNDLIAKQHADGRKEESYPGNRRGNKSFWQSNKPSEYSTSTAATNFGLPVHLVRGFLRSFNYGGKRKGFVITHTPHERNWSLLPGKRFPSSSLLGVCFSPLFVTNPLGGGPLLVVIVNPASHFLLDRGYLLIFEGNATLCLATGKSNFFLWTTWTCFIWIQELQGQKQSRE